MAGIGIADFVVNLFGGISESRRRSRALSRYMRELREEQSRWDELYGPLEEQTTAFLTGTETEAQRQTREGAERRIGTSTFNQLAPGIASDVSAGSEMLGQQMASRGLATSPTGGRYFRRLFQSATRAGAQARAAAIDEARKRRMRLLMSAGRRPSLARGYLGQATTSLNEPVSTFSLLYGLGQLGE